MTINRLYYINDINRVSLSSHNTAAIGFVSHLTGDASCEIGFDLKYKGSSQDFVITFFLYFQRGLFKVCLVVVMLQLSTFNFDMFNKKLYTFLISLFV